MKPQPKRKYSADALQQAREWKLAYGQVFDKPTPANALVMKDLERFCRKNKSTFHPDARVSALLEGRREVVLRIRDFCELSLEELVEKYGGEGNGVPQ